MPNGLDFSLMTLNYKDFTFLTIMLVFIVDFFIYGGVSYLIQNYEYFNFDLWYYIKTVILKKKEFIKKIDALDTSENKCKCLYLN